MMKNIDFKKAYKLVTLRKSDKDLKDLFTKGPSHISVSVAITQ